MAVVGANEVETNTLSIHTRVFRELGVIPVDEVVDKMKDAIAWGWFSMEMHLSNRY